jgi:protocatechuate 3,4-dioxygenase beta subunit
MLSPKKMNRRTMLQLGLGATAGTVTGNLALAGDKADCKLSPEQVMGPFYPIHEQDDKDLDLTMLKGHTERAKGEVIWVRGKILDEDCNPMPGVFMEIWQTNAAGRYNHVKDKNPAPLDPNFQSWGQTVTDDKGNFGFKTIKPAAYPLKFLKSGEADKDAGYRTPHIHFKISQRGYHELVTQCYFPGEPLNDKDGPFSNLSKEDQERLTVVPREGKKNVFGLNFTLKKVNVSTVDRTVLDSYVGQYSFKDKEQEWTYTVTREGNQLYVEIDAYFPKVEIRPLANGRFSYSARSDGKEISFSTSKTGKVTALTIHPKKGEDVTGKKV